MTEVQFSCTACRSALSASKSDVGELIQCPSCGHTLKVPVYGVIKGMKLGDFTIEECLGVGGMGEVWLANQESLHRKVALKILSPEISRDESFVKRFNQEVKIAGQLSHPNIVVAYNAGEQDGIRYLTTTYVEGTVVSDILEKDGAMSEHEVLRIAREIAKALKYAWEKLRILHRDVKPDNIMIANDGTPMLMDMGISKNMDEDISLTMTGEILGTPNYISPEQAHADTDIDFRADQYSLGATFFHLLTGLLPYRATSAMGILAQHLQDPVPDVRDLNDKVSEECAKMIQKMMAKSRDDRYSSWDEFIVAANLLLPPEMRDGTILPGTLTVDKGENRRSFIMGILSSIIIIALLLTSFIYMTKRRTPQNKKDPTIAQPSSDAPVKTPAISDKRPERPAVVDRPVKDTPRLRDGKKGPGLGKGKYGVRPRDNADVMQHKFHKKVKNRIEEEISVNDTQADKLATYQIEFLHALDNIREQDLSSREKYDASMQERTKYIEKAKTILNQSQFSEFKTYLESHKHKFMERVKEAKRN